MADHDDEVESEVVDAPYVPSGMRRSTFTPPKARITVSTEPVNEATLDDEAAPDDEVEEGPILPPHEGGASDVAPTIAERPHRTSLPDDELVRSLDDETVKKVGTRGAIEQLESQMLLREREAREFGAWESVALAVGTPEVLETLEHARIEFTGVIPIQAPREAELPAAPAADPEEEPEPSTQAPIVYDLVPPDEASRPTATEPSVSVPGAAAPVASSSFDDVVAGGAESSDEVASEAIASETVAPQIATGGAHIEPSFTPRIATGEQVSYAPEPRRQPIFSLETSGIEPTPLDQRVGRAARMFWLWFAANSSVVSIAFGAALYSLGMSLRQAILAAFIGVAISFLPLGLGTLAGKWSGQPTMVVSRATFGLVGNSVPAILAVITRLFWGAVLLWIVAASAARILVGAEAGGAFSELQLTVICSAAGFILALVVAFFGYPLFARIQLILSIVSAVLIIGLIAVTWHSVNISAALTRGDGPWILVVTGVVLVFSFVGLVWANSSGDLARYQRQDSSGAVASLWAPFGATLPAFLLVAYGALLAASGSATAHGLTHNPMDAIALLMPDWYPLPLLLATVLSLLSGIALSIYSGAFALQAAGVRVQRQWAIVFVGAALFAISVVLTFTVSDLTTVFRDVATSLAVPVAAWAGIFAAEVMIRRRRFDTDSLLRPGGVYPAVNWVNLGMLLVASIIGFGFTSASVGWLSWQGYGFTLVGVPLGGELGSSDLGVLVALALGILTPLVAGVRTVRRQEGA